MNCMGTDKAPLASLMQTASDYANKGYIDSLNHLQNSNVFLFSGIHDTTVNPTLVKKAEAMYHNYSA